MRHRNQANTRALNHSTNARAVLAYLNRRQLYPEVFLEERIAPQAKWRANTGFCDPPQGSKRHQKMLGLRQWIQIVTNEVEVAVIARNVEGIAAIPLPGMERACLPAGLVEYGKAVIRLLRTAPRISLVGEGLWAAR